MKYFWYISIWELNDNKNFIPKGYDCMHPVLEVINDIMQWYSPQFKMYYILSKGHPCHFHQWPPSCSHTAQWPIIDLNEAARATFIPNHYILFISVSSLAHKRDLISLQWKKKSMACRTKTRKERTTRRKSSILPLYSLIVG